MTKSEYLDGLCRALVTIEELRQEQVERCVGLMLSGKEDRAKTRVTYYLVPIARQAAATRRAFESAYGIKHPAFDEETSGGG